MLSIIFDYHEIVIVINYVIYKFRCIIFGIQLKSIIIK